MNKSLFDRIVQQLVPEMTDPASRRAVIHSALFGSPILHQIQWDGAARVFTVRLIQQLHEYGEIEGGTPAVVALLDEVTTQVGVDKQSQIKLLIQDYLSQTQKGHSFMALDTMILIGFLLEVGRWAKSELSEIWELRREQQKTDLTDRKQVEQTIPEQLENILTEKSARDVERIVALIERKRDAIDRARNAKLADREQLDRQEILQSAFEQLEKKHNATIRQMLDEIEADLGDLGFEVEREPA